MPRFLLQIPAHGLFFHSRFDAKGPLANHISAMPKVQIHLRNASAQSSLLLILLSGQTPLGNA